MDYLEKEDIKELQRIYEKNYNMKISYEEATEKAREIMNFMELIYEPMTEEDMKKVKERREETQKIVEELYEDTDVDFEDMIH